MSDSAVPIYFRCQSCRKVVTSDKVRERGKCRCGWRRFEETTPSLWARVVCRLLRR